MPSKPRSASATDDKDMRGGAEQTGFLLYRAPKAGECRAIYFATGCLSRERLTASYRAMRFITEVRGVSRALDTPRSASATDDKDMCAGAEQTGLLLYAPYGL